MDLSHLITPKKNIPIRLERTRRFVRKPAEKAERSASKKSSDHNLKEMYIKTPTSVKRDDAKGPEGDFFEALA